MCNEIVEKGQLVNCLTHKQEDLNLDPLKK